MSIQRVNQITPQHIQQLQGYIDRGDRGGFYYHYHQLSGSEQIVEQAQITTYSGPWGGGALTGNYLAKQANPNTYKLDLDQFSMDIVEGTMSAIKKDVQLGGTGILTDDQLQAADYGVWADKGMGDHFPGNIEIPQNALTPGAFKSGTIVPFGLDLGSKYHDFSDPNKYEDVFGPDDDSRFIIVKDKETGKIVYFLDKESLLVLGKPESNYLGPSDKDSYEWQMREKIRDYMGANIEEGEEFDPNMKDPGFSIYDLALDFDIDAWFSEIKEELINTYGKVKSKVNELYERAINWAPRTDPLVLDLDGDGIETLAADGRVLFDHDGDGIKHATGWAAPDDGILVFDRNENGQIDNGGELFGENTILASGEKASDGFSALAEFDSNQDGVVNADDENFERLQVWRDLNSDGIADEGELFKLEEAGIAGINTGSKTVSKNLGNNNFITAQGSFIKSDGSEGEAGAAANLDFGENKFYREFPDKIDVPQELESLPDMQGSGAARDLQEAAAQSSQLTNILRQYQAAQTRDEQLALLDELLQTWANASGFKHFVDRLNDTEIEHKYTVSTGVNERVIDSGYKTKLEFRITKELEEDSELSVESSGTGGGGGNSIGTDGPPANAPYDGSDLVVGRFADRPHIDALAKIKVLEAFNNQKFFDFTPQSRVEESESDEARNFETSVSVSTGASRRRVSSRGGRVSIPPSVWYITDEDLRLSDGQVNLINRSYEQLINSVYEALLPQTRLKSYLDLIEVDLGGNKVTYNFSKLNETLYKAMEADPVNGVIDFLEFIQVNGSKLRKIGWDINSQKIKQIVVNISIDEINTLKNKEFEVTINEIRKYTNNDKNYTLQISSDEEGQTQYGTNNTNVIIGGTQKDQLYGQGGNDLLIGGKEKDRLYGGDGNDQLEGGAGNDHLEGDAGNDVLRGGAGNDTLRGEAGSDTYLFGRGDGQDLIYNYDRAEGRFDVLQLDEGIATSDVRMWRSGSDLYLGLKDTDDQVRIQSYFSGDGAGGYALNAIRFADGTEWDIAHVKATVTTGTGSNDRLDGYATDDSLSGLAGDDQLYGHNGDDQLSGGDGKDKLYGGNGNDQLEGGAGNDHLEGDAGNDVLRGGAGNDTLRGEAGSDTYLFGRGDGQDLIYNYDRAEGRFDVLQLDEGIATSDVRMWRSGSDLYLGLKDTDDQVRIQSYFSGDGAGGYALNAIRFADGTEWDIAHVKATVTTGTGSNDRLDGYATDDSLSGLAGDDQLYGHNGDDQLSGGDGKDKLYGGNGNDQLEGGAGNDHLEGDAGNDVLRGGAGNDTLRGEAGSDTYLFGRGDGQDLIYNYDRAEGRFDVLQLDEGIATSDVRMWRSGSDLYLGLKDTDDHVRIQSYFSGDGAGGYALNAIRFADGTEWDIAHVKATVTTGTGSNDRLDGYATDDSLSGLAGDDQLYGHNGDDQLSGGDGKDKLYGGNGNDQLEGGAGNDHLEGDAGNDVLRGGAGNDTLRGEAGSDTYLFGRGDGQDLIYNYDRAEGRFDVLQLDEGIATSDVRMWRSGSDLYLGLKDTDDHVRIQSYFSGDGAGGYALNAIRFADGTEWDIAHVKATVTTGTGSNDRLDGYATDDSLSGLAGDDQLYGHNGDDQLSGGDGKDKLYGGNGNDQLEGGAGNDHLEGDAGNDVLRGGAGNDTLRGEAGSDTYLFGRGDGQDLIYNYDRAEGRFDVLQLDEGIATSDVRMWRSGSDLYLGLKDTDDHVRIQSYFSGDGAGGYALNAIRFADGTEWDIAHVKATVTTGTGSNDRLDGYATDDSLSGLAGDDQLYGHNGDDQLSGGDGKDKLYGGNGNDQLEGGAGNDHLEGDAGNDVLRGGAGNDTLRGEAGSDTYLFGRGDGQDLIYNYDSNKNSIDTLKLTQLTKNDIWFKKQGNNLIVDVIGSADQTTIQNWFSGANYQLDKIETENSVLDLSQLDNLVQTMAAFNDFETADGNLTPEAQAAIAPVLATAWQPK